MCPTMKFFSPLNFHHRYIHHNDSDKNWKNWKNWKNKSMCDPQTYGTSRIKFFFIIFSSSENHNIHIEQDLSLIWDGFYFINFFITIFSLEADSFCHIWGTFLCHLFFFFLNGPYTSFDHRCVTSVPHVELLCTCSHSYNVFYI